MNVVKTIEDSGEIFNMLEILNLTRFIPTYSSLASLLALLRRSAGDTQVAFQTPPGQTTIPEDPDRSGGSSSSTESKSEIYAQNVATDFLKATHSTVARWMSKIEWFNSEAKVHLFPQYIPVLTF